MIAGGVESMSRAPFVMGKAEMAFSRNMKIEDTTIGWRLVNPLMKAKYGVHSMPEAAENVAEEFQISRIDQDAFALSADLQRLFDPANYIGLAEQLVDRVLAARSGDQTSTSK